MKGKVADLRKASSGLAAKTGGATEKVADQSAGKAMRWTIGRKLTMIVVASITFGYSVLIAVQIRDQAEEAYDLALNKNIHLTGLLAAQAAGGIRWRKPEAIDRAYETLRQDPDSTLSSVIALDAHGLTLTGYEAGQYASIDLYDELAKAGERLNDGEIYSARTKNHLVMFIPVKSGRQNTRVGTLGIAWSLEPHHRKVMDALTRQAILGAATTFGLIIIVVFLLNRVVTTPLRKVTRVTLCLASGQTNIGVPYAERGDEIGDMARSLGVFKENLATIDRLSEQQRKQNERLADALESERNSNAMQRDFVAMASHEFRTPLTIIDSSAQRIERRLDRMDQKQVKEKITKVRSAVKRMTTLIESVLSSSSLDAGSLRVEVEQCNLKHIVTETCNRQQGISPDHNIAVDLDGLPEDIVGDPRLLEQVFTNLLSNAVKYAPNDPDIDVIGRAKGHEAVVSVRDRGVGIPSSEQQRVFDRYFRASTSTGIAGTGIGLNLVVQTVELHGGRIDVESREGEGTTFTVTLPVRTLTPASTGADATSITFAKPATQKKSA